MSPNKTLYIRDDDLGTWDRAESYAKATGQSVSTLVAAALGRYLPPEGAKEEICVEVGEPPVRTVFTGRWLVRPEPGLTGTADTRFYGDAYFGVAITGRGRFAVYVAYAGGKWPSRLVDYDSLGEVKPADIAAMAAAELGRDEVFRLDI